MRNSLSTLTRVTLHVYAHTHTLACSRPHSHPGMLTPTLTPLQGAHLVNTSAHVCPHPMLNKAHSGQARVQQTLNAEPKPLTPNPKQGAQWASTCAINPQP
eukprot:366342-Chlamydomonas_euryale.AAC.4